MSQPKNVLQFFLHASAQKPIYDVFRAFQFVSAEDRKKIDAIETAFENFCIGAVNVKYERYTGQRRAF
jgi:hypothetical protein